MKYGIEVNGRLFETDTRENLAERLDIVRKFYAGFVDRNYLAEYVRTVKIYANGQRKPIEA